MEASYRPGHWATWPPAFAPIAAALALLDRASRTATIVGWQLLNVAALGSVLAAYARWCHGRRLSLFPGAGRLPLASLPVLAALLVPFRLVLSNFEHTQANLLILALAVGAFRLLAAGRRAAGGALLGLATAFKATPLLLLGYLAWRGRRADLGAALLGCVAFWALLPLLLLGPGGTARWYAGWSGSVRGVEAGADVANQSLLAVLERLLGTAGAPGWLPLAAWAVLSLALLAAGALAFGRPLRPVAGGREALELAATLVAASLLSPLAWKAHFVALVPLAACLYAAPIPCAAPCGAVAAEGGTGAAAGGTGGRPAGAAGAGPERAAPGAPAALAAAFVAINLTATDLIGPRAADGLERYGVVTWVALFLLLTALGRLRAPHHQETGSPR